MRIKRCENPFSISRGLQRRSFACHTGRIQTTDQQQSVTSIITLTGLSGGRSASAYTTALLWTAVFIQLRQCKLERKNNRGHTSARCIPGSLQQLPFSSVGANNPSIMLMELSVFLHTSLCHVEKWKLQLFRAWNWKCASLIKRYEETFPKQKVHELFNHFCSKLS